MKLYNTPGLSQIYFRRSPLTAIFKEELVRKYGLFFSYISHTGGDEKPRPGFDNWQQPVGQTVNAVSGLPAGRAKRVNPPPLTAIFKEELVRKYGLFFVYCTHRGDEKPRPGVRQLATASWTDRERSERAARRASEASQSPPPHRHL